MISEIALRGYDFQAEEIPLKKNKALCFCFIVLCRKSYPSIPLPYNSGWRENSASAVFFHPY